MTQTAESLVKFFFLPISFIKTSFWWKFKKFLLVFPCSDFEGIELYLLPPSQIIVATDCLPRHESRTSATLNSKILLTMMLRLSQSILRYCLQTFVTKVKTSKPTDKNNQLKLRKYNF